MNQTLKDVSKMLDGFSRRRSSLRPTARGSITAEGQLKSERVCSRSDFLPRLPKSASGATLRAMEPNPTRTLRCADDISCTFRYAPPPPFLRDGTLLHALKSTPMVSVGPEPAGMQFRPWPRTYEDRASGAIKITNDANILSAWGGCAHT